MPGNEGEKEQLFRPWLSGQSASLIGVAFGLAPDSSLYPSPPRQQPLEDGLQAPS